MDLMEAQLIMAFIAAVAAAGALFVSFSAVLLNAQAERAYLHTLRARADELRNMRAHMMDRGVITPEELAQLIASLDQIARSLPTKHQRLIAQGLHQRSLRGRARYAAKLMNGAGIGSGPLPIATP
jgi:hypothetical protein